MPDLVKLGDVRSWQGALSVAATAADGILAELITSTSADFLRAIERTDLLAADYTEQRVGDGSVRLVMRHWPVNSVASVNLAGSALPAGAFGVDLSLDPERRYVLYLSGAWAFSDGAAVAVTYNAGYVTVPRDIQQAVVEWVVLRYNKKSSTGMTQMRERDGEKTDADPNALPAATQRVIDLYKRKWPTYGHPSDTQAAAQPAVVMVGHAPGKR